MSIRDKLKAGGSKVVRAAMAGVLAVGLMPLPAFADDLTVASIAPQADSTEATAMDPGGYVIAAAHAAANPAPEILGLNNPNQRSDSEAEQTYNFFGDPDINESPDPYLYNHHNGLTPGVTIGGRAGQSPMSALSAYDATDPDAAQNKVWELRPHIVLGTGSDEIPVNERDFYADRGDAAAVESALDLEAGSYKPIGVTYNRVSLPTMVQTMYRLAKAADDVTAADANLKTRYGKPLDIAKNYERYIVGQKGLVKQAIDTGKAKSGAEVREKTVALVQSYDSSAKTYTIITDGVAEGTATTNRYLEAVQGVSKNYYDTVGAEGASKVTAAQLKSNVDLVILGSAAGTDNTDPVSQALAADGLLGKAYFCVNWANGSAFGTTVNSVENAQNVGRILPCLYPEVLDQSDMVAYYYETFYHLKAGSIASTIAERMDGVRNQANTDSAAYTAWEATDVDGYDRAKVQARLVEGVSYLNSLDGAGLSDYLKPTDNLKGDKADVNLADAKVTVSAGALAGGKAEPEPTVTYGAATLAKGADYTVAYAGNTAVGNTATVTVTAVEGSGYTGSNSATFKVIEAADNFSGLTAELSGGPFAYTGKAVEPKVTVKDGDTELAEGTDYVVSYANNVAAATVDAELAPTVTITGITNYAGTKTEKFAIAKAKPGATITTDKATYDYGAPIEISTTVDSSYTNDGGKLKISSSDEAVIKEVEKTERGQKTKVWSIVGPGEATLTVTGVETANCEVVTASTKVTVNAVDISGYGSQLKKLDTDWGYTGSDIVNINKNISLADDNKNTLKEGTDYTVSFTRTADDKGKSVTEGAVEHPKELGAYKMTVTGMGGYAKSFDFTVKVVPYLTVYKQVGKGTPGLAYTFNREADFRALISENDKDPISALYYKDGWNVSTAKTYVRLDAVIDKAGLSDIWTDGSMVTYGGDARQGKTSNTFTKAQLDALMFYPKAGPDTTSSEDAIKSPFVFALEEYASAIAEDKTAADAQTANLKEANTSTAPRSVLGVSAEDYAAKSGTTAAGKRLWNNITSISIVQQEDVSETATVSLDSSAFTYDGTEKKPAVTVKIGDTELTADTDYTVEYSDNTNVGTGKATVKFQGYYTGTKEAEFTISAKSVADSMISDIAALTYTGSALTPDVTVRDGDTTLVKDKDFAVKHTNNTNAGTATATITGKGNYTGTASKAFTISRAAQTVTVTSGDAASVEAGKTLALGAATTGGGALTYRSSNDAVATVAADGTVTGVAAGTATVTVTAEATDNYEAATKDVTITVTAAPAPSADTTAPAAGTTVADVSAGSGTTVDVKVSSSSSVTVTNVETKANGSVNLNTVTVNGQTYKVTTVAAGALKGSTAKKVTVGNNVTKLGKGALQNTKKLTKLTLGKNLKTIGKNVLKGSKVKKVTLKSAKLNKKNLTNLVKGSNVKTIKLSGVSAKAKKNYKKWAKSLGVTVK